MKKHLFFVLMLMALSLTATAQNKKMKIAVMDFKAGVGVNVNEVEGLSDMLINTMYESGKFSIVERSQINQVLDEQKFQASELTNEQLAQVGRILGVESVLIGTVNYLSGEYNVDVRAVDVESGEVVTTAGAAKSAGSTYRAMMEKIGRQLAANLTGDTIEVMPVVMNTGLITKGEYFYYLDGQRLTDEEYMNLIRNCPEAWMKYKRGCNWKNTGWIIIGVAGTCVLVGGSMICISGETRMDGIVVAASGVGLSLISIPFFTTGKKIRTDAYKVYNDYCAQPKTTLSFGPATQGVGCGVYLNF